jgi:hypothetical protein
MANYSETLAALQAASTSAGDLILVTPAVETAAYAAGDILFDFTAVPGVTTAAGRVSLLQDVVLIDKGDTGASITLIFASVTGTMGTVNSAPSITDAAALNITGFVQIANADWIDLGGVRMACLKNIGLVLKPTTTTSYIAAIVTSGGTAPTFTSTSDLQIGLGILQG